MTQIACDMRTAEDTPAERLAEYARLFEAALLRRERGPGRVVFAFRGDARAAVEDLARRETACCSFLDYRVDVAGEEVVWTITNPLTGHAGAAAEAVLGRFSELPGSTVDSGTNVRMT